MAASKKKDFSAANMEPVYNTIAEAIAAPETADTPETVEAPETQETPKAEPMDKKPMSPEMQEAYEMAKKKMGKEAHKRGRKVQGKQGAKLARLNLAMTADLYDYIRIMARVRGETMGEFVEHAVKESREKYKDVYQQAQELIERMGG